MAKVIRSKARRIIMLVCGWLLVGSSFAIGTENDFVVALSTFLPGVVFLALGSWPPQSKPVVVILATTGQTVAAFVAGMGAYHLVDSLLPNWSAMK